MKRNPFSLVLLVKYLTNVSLQPEDGEILLYEMRMTMCKQGYELVSYNRNLVTIPITLSVQAQLQNEAGPC